MKCQNAMIDLSNLSWAMRPYVLLPGKMGIFVRHHGPSGALLHGPESDFAAAGLTIGDLEDLLNQKRYYRLRVPSGVNRGLWDCFGYLTGLECGGNGGIVAIEITGITGQEKVYEVPECTNR